MEIWKDVIGYEGLYQVSSLGRIKSVCRRVYNPGLSTYRIQNERILKTFPDKKGYIRVILSKEGKIKIHLLHRIVAKAFLSNPNNYPQINHIDENPRNNSVNNLEWCDNKYNTNYRNHPKRIVESQSIPIVQYDLNGHIIKEWSSAREAERQLKIPNVNILRCCCGGFFMKSRNKWVQTKQAGGFIWRYKHE